MSEESKPQEAGVNEPPKTDEAGKDARTKTSAERNARWAKAGIGAAAIGSAAIVAALLYVNHSKRNDRS